MAVLASKLLTKKSQCFTDGCLGKVPLKNFDGLGNLNRSNTVALISLAKCEERKIELMERSKLIICGHGAKASYVTV